MARVNKENHHHLETVRDPRLLFCLLYILQVVETGVACLSGAYIDLYEGATAGATATKLVSQVSRNIILQLTKE